MGLVLFALMFLFGATGMERQRGVGFCMITTVVLFVWVLPVIIEEARPYGRLYLVLLPVVTLVVAILIPLLCFFAGQWTRALLRHMPRTNSRSD